MSFNLGSLGSLFIDVAANTAHFESDMGRAAKIAEKRSKEMQRSILEAGEKIFAAFEAYKIADKLFESISKGVERFDAMGKAAQRVGIGVAPLSQLDYAAKAADISFDALTMGLQHFNKAIVDAKNGSREQQAAFQALGVSAADLKNLSPQELLYKVADGFRGAKDGADKTAVSMALFSRAGAELIPLLNGGSAGLAKMAAESDRLHNTIDEQVARSAEEFNDNLKRIKSSLQGVANIVAERALPVLVEYSDQAANAAGNSENFETAAKQLETGLKLVAETGLATVSTFQQVGTVVGGVAAFWTRIGEGNKLSDLSAGWDLFKDSLHDASQTGEQYWDRMVKVWEAGAEKINKVEENLGKSESGAGQGNLHFRPADLEAAAKAEEEHKHAIEQLQKLGTEMGANIVKEALLAKGNKETEASTIAYRLAVGDLHEVLLKAGAAGQPFADQLLKQAAVYDQAKQAADDYAESERKTQAIIADLQQRYGPGKSGKDYRTELSDAQRKGSYAGIDQAQSGATASEADRYKTDLSNQRKNREKMIAEGVDYDKLEEAAAKQHQDELTRISTEASSARNDLTSHYLSVGEQITGNLLQAAESAGLNRSRRTFQLYKQIAAVQAAVATAGAIANALQVPPYPLGVALAISAGVAGAAQIAAIESQQFPGRRYGGNVAAAGIYDVAEPGNPELLKYGNKTLLMMGDQSGSVTPARAVAVAQGGDSGARVTVHNYAGANVQARQMSDGEIVVMVRDAHDAAVRNARGQVLRDMGDASSPLTRQIARTHGTQPRAVS